MKIGATYEFPCRDGRTHRYTVIRIDGRLVTGRDKSGACNVFSKGSQTHLNSVEVTA